MKYILRILFLVLIMTSTAGAVGSIMIFGGGSDTRSWATDPFVWFVQQADSGLIINIDADEVATSYATTFIKYGADPASYSLRIKDRGEANDSNTYDKLIAAKGIFIEGGDQWDYVSNWKGTLVEDAIHYVFENGGVIAGTSAGCAIMGEVSFDAKYGSAYPDDSAVDPYNNRIHLEDDFLHVLPDVLTDSHFHERGRLGRLVPMLARRIQDNGDDNLLGIGVDLNTAFCITADRVARVMGEGVVTILHKTEKSIIHCEANEPLTFTHIRYHQLNYGAVFDLNARNVVDAGPNMEAVTSWQRVPEFATVTLNGSLEQTGSSGSVKISSYTRNETDAWYGRLNMTSGDSLVPNSIIIPRIWSDNDYYENRIIGGMYAVSRDPGLFAIYLDDGSELEILANNTFKVNKLAYILETQNLSHTGILKTRNTNFPGLVGATLHFLGDGMQISWLDGFVNIKEKKSEKMTPDNYRIFQNYPNPFNPNTTIEYALQKDAEVNMTIYNLNGQFITTLFSGFRQAGNYEVRWNGSDQFQKPVSSGVYMIKMICAGKNETTTILTKKIALLK